MNLAIFASGSGSNMQAIVDYGKGKKDIYTVALILSNQKEAYVLERGNIEKIPTAFMRQRDFDTEAGYIEALLERLQRFDIDCIALAGFLEILPKDFISNWQGKIFNIHPSLLPAFGGKGAYGLHVHEMAIERGVKVSGATVHLVTAGIDEGPIVCQKVVDVLEGDSPKSLQQRIMEEAEWKIYPRVLEAVAQKRVVITNNHATIIDP